MFFPCHLNQLAILPQHFVQTTHTSSTQQRIKSKQACIDRNFWLILDKKS